MKYPLEIEFTSFCSLCCKVCINKDSIKRGNMSLDNFHFIVDYIDINKEEILYINFAGIGDIFMHPHIIQFLNIFKERFKGSGIKLLIPTKGQNVNINHIILLKELERSGINVNLNVGFYSFSKNIQDEISGGESFSKMFQFLILLKKFRLPFSIELVSNKLDEYRKLQKYASYFGCGYSIQNFHNFAGRIKGENFGLNRCSFDEQEYKMKDIFCSFIPFIDFSGNIYPCSISSGKNEFFLGNIKKLFKKFPHYIDLVHYVKDNISEIKCMECSVYKTYEKESSIGNNNNKSV